MAGYGDGGTPADHHASGEGGAVGGGRVRPGHSAPPVEPPDQDRPGRGASGVQVGSGNVQVNNYFYDSSALTKGGMPLALASGAMGSAYEGHAFISYVREDSTKVGELQYMLQAAGIPVWRDTANLWPGEDWRARIRDAITRDALVFIACFSSHSAARLKSYMNEELSLAVEQLRQRRPQDPWLIPVRFDDCAIPDLDLGAGRTLASIQRADLFGASRDEAGRRLVGAVQRLLPESVPRLAGRLVAEWPTTGVAARPSDDSLRRIAADRVSPAGEDALRISLLGAPASGKTTYLAALSG